MYMRITKGIMLLAMAATIAGCRVPAARTGIPVAHNLPPANMLMEPGPGVGGPGPGVLAPGRLGPGPGMAMGGGMMGGGEAVATPQNVQVKFDKPAGMHVQWDVTSPGAYDSTAIISPGRQNFAQGGVFRLKLTNIPGREGLELYPTLEVGPASTRTAAYIAHSAVPIQFTEEDFDQVTAGNFVTKVIYVPDPEFQELALAGIETLVSTRLDPGVDPIVEADRRGAILAVIRVGNKDMQVPGTDAGMMGNSVPGGGGQIGFGSTSGYISGITGPTYGMAHTGTSIGLPGPPHIPMGGPAGLRRYSMNNHTATNIPGPTNNVAVHVKQRPGLTYPRPADRVLIQEETIRPPHFNSQPPADMVFGDIPPQGCSRCGGRGCGSCR